MFIFDYKSVLFCTERMKKSPFFAVRSFFFPPRGLLYITVSKYFFFLLLLLFVLSILFCLLLAILIRIHRSLATSHWLFFLPLHNKYAYICPNTSTHNCYIIHYILYITCLIYSLTCRRYNKQYYNFHKPNARFLALIRRTCLDAPDLNRNILLTVLDLDCARKDLSNSSSSVATCNASALDSGLS